MFKKEWIHCPVLNKTRNTYFLFLITAPFFQTLSFMVSGTGHRSTLDKQCNCFPYAVHQTKPLLNYCRTCTCFLSTNPLLKCHVLTYPVQKGNCNTKGQSTWLPLVHPCLHKQSIFTGQSSAITISGSLSKNGTVFILYCYWLLKISYMFLFVQDRTIIKGALELKVSVWPALTLA